MNRYNVEYMGSGGWKWMGDTVDAENETEALKEAEKMFQSNHVRVKLAGTAPEKKKKAAEKAVKAEVPKEKTAEKPKKERTKTAGVVTAQVIPKAKAVAEDAKSETPKSEPKTVEQMERELAELEKPKVETKKAEKDDELKAELNADVFKALAAVEEISEDPTLLFDGKLLNVKVMDASQIGMVGLSVPVPANRKETLALNLTDVGKIFKGGNAKADKMSLQTTNNKAKAELIFTEDGIKTNYALNGLQENACPPRSPNIAYNATVELDATALKKALQKVGMLSAHVIFDVRDGKLKLSANSASGNGIVEVGTLSCGGQAKAMFPYEFLQKMLKYAVGKVNLELKADSPIRMNYEIGTAKMEYFLAPRVEQD